MRTILTGSSVAVYIVRTYESQGKKCEKWRLRVLKNRGRYYSGLPPPIARLANMESFSTRTATNRKECYSVIFFRLFHEY